MQAGLSGLLRGFARAAYHLEQQNELSLAYTYYVRAAREHALTKYDDAASLALQLGQKQDALELYLELAQQGDPVGYSLAASLLKKDAPAKAATLYSIDFYSAYGYLVEQAQSPQEREALKKTRLEIAHQRIKRLSDIAGFGQLT